MRINDNLVKSWVSYNYGTCSMEGLVKSLGDDRTPGHLGIAALCSLHWYLYKAIMFL